MICTGCEFFTHYPPYEMEFYKIDMARADLYEEYCKFYKVFITEEIEECNGFRPGTAKELIYTGGDASW